MRLHSVWGARLEKPFSSLERFGYARAALIVVIVLMISLVALRFYHASVTGFILPDEAWYYNTFIFQNQPLGAYREVFVATYRFFFQGARDISSFFLRGALYCAVWVVGCVLVTFKIIRRLEVPEKTASLLLLSLPLFPVFTIMAVTVTTETFGLFLALVGIYFAIRYLRSFSALDAFLSSACFVMAYKVREPYLIFAVGNLLLILLSRKKSLSAILAYAVPLALVFPIPISLEPLRFAQPVYALLIQILSPTPVLTTQVLFGSTFDVPVDPRAAKVDSLLGFLIGLAYGFNPLFVAFTFISLGLVAHVLKARRSGMTAFTLLNMALALSGYLISVLLVIGTLATYYASAIAGWTSTIIRMSHTALPAPLLGFRYLYERVKARYLVALLFVLILLGSTQLPQLTYAMQRALSGPLGESIDRLSFNYRAPYYRLYLLAKDSGKTLVVTTQDRGIILYMSLLPNVVVDMVPLNQTMFKALLDKGWDTIFLYDDWYTIKDPSFAVKYQWYPPYYLDILLLKQYEGYMVETLWVDGESYALRMMKVSTYSYGNNTASYVLVHPVCPFRTGSGLSVAYPVWVWNPTSDDMSVRGVASRSINR